MSRGMKVAGVGVLVAALVAGGAYWGVQRSRSSADAEARRALTSYAASLSGGGLARAAGLTSAKAAVEAGEVTRDGDTARAALAVTWTLPGGATWRYSLPATVTRGEDGTWSPPSTPRVHPDLEPGQKLRLRRTQPERAPVLGRDGSPVVSTQDVVDVGLQRARITGSVATTVTKVAALLDVEAASLRKRVEAAQPTTFVDVITLRMSDYDAVRSQLRPIPGVVLRARQQALAPTREFARALLGTVGPVTAEIIDKGEGRYAPGDFAGVSGLQAQYDERLAGTAGVTVEPAAGAGETADALFTTQPQPGEPVRTSLDPAVQRAADAALAGLAVPGALVAVDTRTGDVLAVANTPAAGFNRALVGRYPPGSTFKVVSTLALLGKGLTPAERVECPPTATVDGRSFKNYEDEEFGSVPFSTDFAKSCNTAFVKLSSRLGSEDLRRTAASLGIGVEYATGVAAYSGSVPATESDVDKAASTFGQGRNLVSPLAVTVASASVARGQYVAPRVVLDPAPDAASTQAAGVDAGDVATLRTLMRSVVTSGTGTALRSVPGGPVFAKTGTAEYGSGSPPPTHAWITGWQGDVAFTVFVEQGKSGGTVAGPVAARFLTALGR